MSHGLARLLEQIWKSLGLPDWAFVFFFLPAYLIAGMGAILLHRKYIQILRRKIQPYGGRLKRGFFFWAPTATFEVDGIPGELPWGSIRGKTRIRFRGPLTPGRLLLDSRGLSSGDCRSIRGEPVTPDDKIFNSRFQVASGPPAFGERFLDAETRKHVVALLHLSRGAGSRGRTAEYFVAGSTDKGKLRLEMDGRELRLRLDGPLGTKELEVLLEHAAALCRRAVACSAPA